MPEAKRAPDDISVYEIRLRAAILSGNVATLDALLADDLLFTDHAGRLLTKEMDLEVHRSGRLRMTRLDFSDALSRDVDGAVIVVVRAAIAGTFDNMPFAGDYRYTRVWRKHRDGWQVAAAHCSTIL